ncbi:hypothetical protein K7432_004241 [Basidiobolus ranarum]|uniref:Uncharacterized protein n=1 Tax=Basidiobolus ranarum TaxID=34480 RepID=A0ABR2WYI6_9FUNG
MKFSSTISFTILALSSVAADLFLQPLPANNTCSDAPTYTKCRENVISSNCLASDSQCLCRQANDAVRCFLSCQQDTRIYNYYPMQTAEQTKLCQNITLPTTPNPVAPSNPGTNPNGSGSGTSSSAKTNPTSNIFSGSSAISSFTVGSAGVILGAVAYFL